MKARLQLGLLVCVACGCGDDFEPYSHIHSLSLLAIVAEPPEVAPGEVSQLRAWVADPTGLGRPVSFEWAICTLTPFGSDRVNPECVTSPSGAFLTPVPGDAMASVTMPDIPTSQLGPADVSGGLYVPVRLIVRAGSDEVVAIHRLRRALAGPPNHNPVLSSFEVQALTEAGVEPPLAEGAAVDPQRSFTMSAALAPGSAEDYMAFDAVAGANRQHHELLRFSWFVTVGTVRYGHSGEDQPNDTWQTDAHLTDGGPIDLWAVVRDERGGAAIAHRGLVLRR